MKIHLLSRIRNEADIIADTIRHWQSFVTGSIVIYDDMSTDNTRDIIRSFPGVTLIRGNVFHRDRDVSEYYCRQRALQAIHRTANPGDWIFCADADERYELDWAMLPTLSNDVPAIKIRLFDYYITPEDVGKGWQARTWIGPEYRDIIMLWKYDPRVIFNAKSARVPTMPFALSRAIQSGYCHHYGKARSVAHWEAKIDYYDKNPFSGSPGVRDKWRKRRGRAVKGDYNSDFRLPLIKWEEKEERGVPLTKAIHEREFR